MTKKTHGWEGSIVTPVMTAHQQMQELLQLNLLHRGSACVCWCLPCSKSTHKYLFLKTKELLQHTCTFFKYRHHNRWSSEKVYSQHKTGYFLDGAMRARLNIRDIDMDRLTATRKNGLRSSNTPSEDIENYASRAYIGHNPLP